MEIHLECREGLECREQGQESLDSGFGICEDPYNEEPVGLGETCDGFNESTGRPFPRCDDGLVCRGLGPGFISIPGRGSIC